MWIHNLDELQMMLAVYETGSFTEAGRKLGRSTSAVSAGIRRLESDLGVRLLERSTRSLCATPEGEILLEHGRRALDILEVGRDRSRNMGGALAGQLSVAASALLGTYFLADWLAEFAQRHPGIELQLRISDTHVEMVRSGVHLALRNGPLDDSSLSARHLVDATWVACASPTYLQRKGIPQHPSELVGHECIRHYVRDRLLDRWIFFPKSGEPAIEVPVVGPLRTDNVAIAVQWALAGRGVLYQSSLVLGKLLSQNALIPLFEGYRGRQVPLYAVFPERRLVPYRVRCLVDELVPVITNLVPS